MYIVNLCSALLVNLCCGTDCLSALLFRKHFHHSNLLKADFLSALPLNAGSPQLFLLDSPQDSVLMRSDQNGNAIHAGHEVGVNEIWALKVGGLEFRAVEEPKGSGTWKGLPVSVTSRANDGAITVGHATFSSLEVWQGVQNYLLSMTDSSNLEYIHHGLGYLQHGNYLDSNLLIWLQPNTGNGFVGLYHQMQALGGSAGGGPLTKKIIPVAV
ncbi:hypothetical protein DFJ43DRAFT_1041202 [Lentinula guzmanii]|uniref:Uncharacterized protein n=1 Tax=Lentinula guzmanii TaxID=2804957 RepID=A0AA38J677_9AGAR|nr:hypothetical protein DFJ43DRAFT_1041202 [Lentinula guzmanii]